MRKVSDLDAQVMSCSNKDVRDALMVDKGVASEEATKAFVANGIAIAEHTEGMKQFGNVSL